ncbi:peptide-methionine (R)-S-oxide reductase MsrB [Patescibacteria group bacterium]|nr:peptide-methionine (R)-S-oxide reductase MsrB [Patescibacteria group bacterium]
MTFQNKLTIFGVVVVATFISIFIFNRSNTNIHIENTITTNTATNTPSRYNPEDFIKPSEEKLRATLTPLQYVVTQKEGTESPYRNEYDNNKEEGLYVDIVSGEPLYSSKDKYDSGTGWPSFVKPISANVVIEKKTSGLFGDRIEIRSRIADSHLGHLFDDGPQDRGGKRYCMNSAAMRFIPKADMEKLGYGSYIKFVE